MKIALALKSAAVILLIQAAGAAVAGSRLQQPLSNTSITITIGEAVFSARLYQHEAAEAFLARLPLAVTMSDLHQNEKYYYFKDKLPPGPTEKPALIKAGDLMVWSGDCLVLFYRTFSNTYGGYVRLGYVEDPLGLDAALGGGPVLVSFTNGAP